MVAAAATMLVAAMAAVAIILEAIQRQRVVPYTAVVLGVWGK